MSLLEPEERVQSGGALDSDEARVRGYDENMYADQPRDLITMSGREKCAHCDKEAIGYQGFGCCSEYVCADHADRFVLDLKPGEQKISGECVFIRFSESA